MLRPPSHLILSILLPIACIGQGTAPDGQFQRSLAALVSKHGIADESGGGQTPPADLAKRLPRIIEAIRRERTTDDLRRLFDYRQGRRIPTVSAADAAVAKAEQQLRKLKKLTLSADDPAFQQALIETDDRLAAARELIDRHWPDGLVVRSGLGPDTFGRYGWRDRFGGLVWDLADWNRLTMPGDTSAVLVSPPGGTLDEREPPVITWVSARHKMTVKTPDGSVPWTVTESTLVPGILLETASSALQVTRDAGGQTGPDRLLLPVRDSALSLRFRPNRVLPVPEDNWLLLAWEKESGRAPVLLVFEKLPARIEWTAEALVVRFSGGAGKVALGSYAGTGPWSPETSRAWQSVPRSVLKRCRALCATLCHFPVGLDELFSVDENHGQVVIVSRPTYARFSFEGRLVKQPATPLAPILSAARPGMPIVLPDLAQTWAMPTRNGPYDVSIGTTATYRLPICRYDHPLAPANTLSQEPLVLPDPLSLGDLCRLFPVWPGLRSEDRKLLAEVAKTTLAEQLAPVASGDASAIEPHGLTLYVDLVADDGGQGTVGTVRRAGLLLDAVYRYAKFTGDWGFVRDHQQALHDLLAAQMALADWAFMSPAPRDGSPLDALPDALRGALAASKMAEAVEDAETLRLSRYLTARLLVPYNASYLAKEPANRQLRWREFGMPETWDTASFPTTVARLAGLPIMPELLDAALTDAREATLQWAQQTIPKQHPDWTNSDLSAACDYWSLRQNLGTDPDSGDGATRKSLLARLAAGSPEARGLSSVSPDAPLRLAEWQPAALGSFVYDRQHGTVRLQLTGATHLRCTTRFAPAVIRDNGKPLPSGSWAHSFQQARLLVALDKGHHNLEFVFATNKDGKTTP